MGAGWKCMVVLTIQPSLSSKIGPPVTKGRETAEPGPVLDGRQWSWRKPFHRPYWKSDYTILSELQQLLYANDDKTTLITLLTF